MLKDLALKNRSYRRFDENAQLALEELLQLVELVRYTPSARNQQALKFMPVTGLEACRNLFDQLSWAGYLKDWPGPESGERPGGYLVVLGDLRLGRQLDVDVGIVSQTILLGATEKGWGGCMIASIKKEAVRRIFCIPDDLSIELVIALGVPVEDVRIVDCLDGDIRYWRDSEGRHFVPKRKLAEIIWGV